MDKEKLAQLMTDYRAGKITAEEFNRLKNAKDEGRAVKTTRSVKVQHETKKPFTISGHKPWKVASVVFAGIGLVFLFSSFPDSLEGVFWLRTIVGALICGALTALVADKKGKDPFTWFVYGTVLFILAFPAILIMKPDEKVLEKRAVEEGDKRICPFCAELIKREAKICRFCNKELPPLSQPQQEDLSVNEDETNIPGKAQPSSCYREPTATNDGAIHAKSSIWLGCGVLLILCVAAFIFFWYLPHQKADEQNAQAQATEIISDINNTLLGVVLVVIDDAGFGTNLAPLPEMSDVLLKLQEASRIQKNQGKGNGVDTTIRHPERFTLFADTTRQNKLSIKYDLSRIPRRVKEKLPLGKIGEYKLQNQDGTPFQGKGNAVYIPTPIKVK